MKDRIGNELEVGDLVLYVVSGRSSGDLSSGFITGMTPKFANVGKRNTRVSPHKTIKLTGGIPEGFYGWDDDVLESDEYKTYLRKVKLSNYGR